MTWSGMCKGPGAEGRKEKSQNRENGHTGLSYSTEVEVVGTLRAELAVNFILRLLCPLRGDWLRGSQSRDQ